ncbi:MAG TPA: Gfo/Idh/MocA family oxidoreductase, partial [Gemmataceae bacterium]
MTTEHPTPAASRRDFLKTSAATLAAGALALERTGGVYAAGGDTLRVGLIGCGGRGSGAAENALKADPNVKLVAMADAFMDRLEASLNSLKKLGEKVDVPPERRFAGFDAYKQLLDCGVDVVILATPPHFRPLHMKAAVEAGKHVFAEKPMAVDAPGVRSVLQTAQEAKKKNLCLVSGFCFRYEPAKRETVKRLHDGAIGEVLAIHANYNTGPIWHRPCDAPFDSMEYQMRNWYYFTWLSGDFNVEQHIHNLDKAAWVLKWEWPIAAVGLGGRQVRT